MFIFESIEIILFGLFSLLFFGVLKFLFTKLVIALLTKVNKDTYSVYKTHIKILKVIIWTLLIIILFVDILEYINNIKELF